MHTTYHNDTDFDASLRCSHDRIEHVDTWLASLVNGTCDTVTQCTRAEQLSNE